MLNQRLEISVRNAQLDDAPALARIFRDSWRLAYAGIIPAMHLEHEILRRDPGWWRRAIRSESNLLILTHGETVEIYELYLAPVYQGIGLGEYLFEACRATLDDLGLPHLVVWALADNETARAFYRRCGGKPARRSCVRLGKAIGIRVAFEW